MKKLIAVHGFFWQFSDPNVQATVVLSGTPSANTSVDGNGACLDGFTATVSAITYPTAGATIPDPGPYNVPFNSTAQNVSDDGTFVLRVDDETDTINATPQIPPPGPGSPTPYPVSFKLQITNAGQSSVSGE